MHYLPSDIPAEAHGALSPAFDRSYVHSTEEWLQRCRDDLAQLWRHNGYWGITEVLETRAGRVFHMVASAGDYEDALVEEMEAWARAQGCSRVLSTVRPGFARKRTDYRVKTMTLEKEL